MIRLSFKRLREHPSEYLYYLAFGLYVLFFNVNHTMFSYGNSFGDLLKYVKLLSVMLVLTKVIVRGKTRTRWLMLAVATLIVLAMVFLSMESTIPIFLMVMLFGAQRTDHIILTKIYLVCAGFVYSAALVASQVGIIEDRILERYTDSGVVMRHSLGTKYVTAFAAVYFFVIAAYLFLNREKLNWKHYVVISAATVVMNIYTDARLETLSIFVLLLCILFFKKAHHLRIVRFVMKNCVPICFCMAFGLTFLYMLDNDRFAFLDRILSERLSLTQKGILEYGFSLFGKVIPMQGYGNVDFDWSIGYFFLDSFYINYTLQYGLVFMALFLFVTHTAVSGLSRSKDYWLLLFVLFTAFHGVIISSVLDVEICPFFYIAYARFTSVEKNPGYAHLVDQIRAVFKNSKKWGGQIE